MQGGASFWADRTDHFQVDVVFRAPGADAGHEGPGRNLRLGFEGDWSTQQHWTTLQGFGDYDFVVAGFDDEDDPPPQGWTSPARLRLDLSDEQPGPPEFTARGPIAERRHERVSGRSYGGYLTLIAPAWFRACSGGVCRRLFRIGARWPVGVAGRRGH